MVLGDNMNLKVLTPERTLLDIQVSKVSLPGSRSAFMVLRNHAPIISSLECGVITYMSDGKEGSFSIKSGFVEVKDNVIVVCAEV